MVQSIINNLDKIRNATYEVACHATSDAIKDAIRDVTLHLNTNTNMTYDLIRNAMWDFLNEF